MKEMLSMYVSLWYIMTIRVSVIIVICWRYFVGGESISRS